MKYALADGTAYLDLISGDKKSAETLPIDDAAIIIDRSQKKPVGFKFETDSPTSSDWLEEWDSFPGGLPKFLSDLSSRDDLQVNGEIYILSDYRPTNPIIEVPASVYVDVNDRGVAVGIEFLFKSTVI